MVSITFIILLITKKYSASVGIIYKRFSKIRDIMAFKLFRAIQEIVGFYWTFLNIYKYY